MPCTRPDDIFSQWQAIGEEVVTGSKILVQGCANQLVTKPKKTPDPITIQQFGLSLQPELKSSGFLSCFIYLLNN